MTTPDALKATGTNNLGALYSFLRVLATNVATALLPLFLLNEREADDYPSGKALVIAVTASFLLTVTNYFRSGETRFGATAPNVIRDDAGRGTIETIGVVLAVVAAVLLVLHLLGVFLTSVALAVVVLIIGVVLILIDRR